MRSATPTSASDRRSNAGIDVPAKVANISKDINFAVESSAAKYNWILYAYATTTYCWYLVRGFPLD